jgi:prepilin-type N-terminal cleavage/methylation domain-containing protein
MKKGFTLIELLIVVAIIGILAAVGAAVIPGLLGKTKTTASQSNHDTVVNFITLSVLQCEIGQELIIKYSYDLNSKQTKYTNDLCPYINAGNAVQMQSSFSNHFNAPPWCNPYGLKHASGTCQEAIANGGSVNRGKLGETQIINTGKDFLIIDTQISDGVYLTKTIKLIN